MSIWCSQQLLLGIFETFSSRFLLLLDPVIEAQRHYYSQ